MRIFIGAIRAEVGKEGRQMAALAKRVRDHLNPPTPLELEAEAERLFALLEGVPCAEEALAEMR